MRADGHQRDRVEAGLHDRAAARQRVGGRPGRRRRDEPVAGVVVDEHAVDARLEVDHAPGFAPAEHDVVERQRAVIAVGIGQVGLQQQPGLGQRAAL